MEGGEGRGCGDGNYQSLLCLRVSYGILKTMIEDSKRFSPRKTFQWRCCGCPLETSAQKARGEGFSGLCAGAEDCAGLGPQQSLPLSPGLRDAAVLALPPLKHPGYRRSPPGP